MLNRRLEYPGTVGLILRRTYPQLYKSHLVKLFQEYPKTRNWYNEQRKEMVFPNSSRLFFGSAEHAKDMSNFYSAEFADILVDEAQEFSQGELEQLSGSCRDATGSSIVPKMVYTFMPGVSEDGIPPKGLSYLKRVFIDKALEGVEHEQIWEFLQAFSWDNIEWARKELTIDGISEEEFYTWSEADRREYFLKHTKYGKNLQAITNKALRDAWLWGKWDAFQGQYFPNFDRDRHTMPHEELLKLLKPWWKFWVSEDWGSDHPYAAYLHCEDESGHIYTIDERWGREIPERQQGAQITQMCVGRNIKEFVLSWDAFGKLNKETRKPISDLIDAGLSENIPYPIPGDSSPGSRISGWRNMSAVLDRNGWTISDRCEKLTKCIPTLMRDMERNSEDVLKVDWSENYIGDDPADAARYGLQYVLERTAKPPEEVASDRVKEYAKARDKDVEELDINTVARLSERALAQEKSRRKRRRGGLGRIWRPGSQN